MRRQKQYMHPSYADMQARWGWGKLGSVMAAHKGHNGDWSRWSVRPDGMHGRSPVKRDRRLANIPRLAQPPTVGNWHVEIRYRRIRGRRRPRLAEPPPRSANKNATPDRWQLWVQNRLLHQPPLSSMPSFVNWKRRQKQAERVARDGGNEHLIRNDAPPCIHAGTGELGDAA
ncbi:hypothetical protein PG997_012853 [Apiospora hydei]|uniref:Uncharacterized protein n=1 Tax=Apiospora hydei TaxID=1337664 RepID=A0ABR1V4I0_9PEZI